MKSQKLTIIIENNLDNTVYNIENRKFIMWNDISDFLIMLLDQIKKNNLKKDILDDVFDKFYRNYNPLKEKNEKIIFDDFISNLRGEILGSPWCVGPDIWEKNTESEDIENWSKSLISKNG